MDDEEGFREGRLILCSLGRVVITRGAASAMDRAGVSPCHYLSAHQRGDWGCVSGNDAAENDASLREGGGVQSVYRIPNGQEIWVITERDRSVTTLLLPEEY